MGREDEGDRLCGLATPAELEARKPARASAITSSPEADAPRHTRTFKREACSFTGNPHRQGDRRRRRKPAKREFTCPDCGQNAWAKPDALLGCYACYEETEELVLMLAEPSDEDEALSQN